MCDPYAVVVRAHSVALVHVTRGASAHARTRLVVGVAAASTTGDPLEEQVGPSRLGRQLERVVGSHDAT